MNFDFNQAEEQKQRVPGPVPAGSIVLLKVEIQRPTNPEYAAKPGSYVTRTKKGLLLLNCQMTVMAGTYEGYRWFENYMLPEGMQTVSLTDGQRSACRISYSKMRAIIEAYRKIDPKDQSPRARSARTLADLMDLSGMIFPCRVGLKKEPREYTKKDGTRGIAWDNHAAFILPVTDSRFAEVSAGGEIITDGPVQGDMPASTGYGNSEASSMGQDKPSREEIPGWDTPPVDDCPF